RTHLLLHFLAGLTQITSLPHYRYGIPGNFLTPPVVPAPVSIPRVEPYDPNPTYEYAYGISDPISKVETKVESSSQNGITRGSYQYVRPDGVLQIVRYVVTPETGYQAKVEEIPGYAPPHHAPHVPAVPVAVTPTRSPVLGHVLPTTYRPRFRPLISVRSPITKVIATTAAPIVSTTLAPNPLIRNIGSPLPTSIVPVIPPTVASFRPSQLLSVTPVVNGHGAGSFGPVDNRSYVSFRSHSHSYGYKK
ncbi:hypothetical protein SK128_014834, partial [Halocaridina rubra]